MTEAGRHKHGLQMFPQLYVFTPYFLVLERVVDTLKVSNYSDFSLKFTYLNRSYLSKASFHEAQGMICHRGHSEVTVRLSS